MLNDFHFAIFFQILFYFLCFLHFFIFIEYGYNPTIIILISSLIALCTFIMVFVLKCKKCARSFFASSAGPVWNRDGINLFLPVSRRCRKCGFERG